MGDKNMDENKNQNGAFDDFSIEDILNSINQKADQKVSEHLNDIKTPEEASASTTDVSTAEADGKADDKSAGNSEKRKKEAAAPDKSGEGVDMATVSFTPVGKGKTSAPGDLFSELKSEGISNSAKSSQNAKEIREYPGKKEPLDISLPSHSQGNSKNRNGKKQKKAKSRGAIGGIIRGTVIVLMSVFIAGLLLFLISDVTGIGKEVFKGADSESEIYITIEEGTPSVTVYEELAEKGIICNAKVFQAYLKLTGKNPAINYGKHQFTKNMGYSKIIKVLEETVAHAEDISVTVRPGATVEDIGAALEKNGICKSDSFIKEVQKGAKAFNSTDGILDSIPDDSDIYYQLEGYLFPETYKFYKNDDPHDVVQKMIDTLAERFTPEMRKAAEQKGYTVHQVLTLASVVQLEAGDAKTADMKKVAQVFYNRLEKWDAGGRFLQSDPTMKYQHNSDAYNTYKSEGLPPGPLCSMNLNVIKACVEPDTSCEAFYFVTDKGMNFYFNNTIDDHNRTINDLISRGMWAEG